MKLSLSTAELLTQLQTATRVASTRSAVQALSGVMISAPAEGTPELLATDMEIGLRIPLAADVARPGSAVLPARLLLDVARSLAVATVSYRLSVKQTALDAALTGSLEANVPARALQELARIAAQTPADTVAISVSQNQVMFELGDVVLSSRLIDGQFPNYRQLLPESVEHELRLASAELTDVVRRISLLAQKNAPLRLSFSEGTLTVSAQTPDVGEASEAIPVPYHGEPLDIGFNPEFLRDGLESIESEELVLKLISPLRPGLIESPDTGDFVYLIMPIRLNV